MIKKSILLISCFILLLACTQEPERKPMIVEDISAEKAHELIKEGNICIVDVRTPDEFNEAHIEGAVNIDVHNASFIQEIDKLDKSKIYLMHCKSGGRSGHALKFVKGFTKIYHMDGGMLEWLDKKLPVK